VRGQKASGPAHRRNGGKARRKVFGTGERRSPSSSDRPKSQIPPTAMADAFIRALVQWARCVERKTGLAEIILKTGKAIPAIDLVNAMTARGITAAKITHHKNSTGNERAGDEIAQQRRI
jgi:hypothetical protein